MGHGDHEGVERKRRPDGQPVRCRSRCQGRQYCSLNSPSDGSSSRHRGLEQRYCLPPDANTPSLRSQCPARSRSCPIIQSVTRRRQEETQRRAAAGPRPEPAGARPWPASPAPDRPSAPGSHDNHPRRTAGSGSMPGNHPGAQQATEKTPKARDRTAKTPTPACTPECQRQT